MRPTILAIESSCDETSASVLRNGKVLNNIIASQNDHAAYGGVVPELASRAHQRKIVEVVQQAMATAGLKNEDLDAVAFTRGPGLMGALLVGSSFAKGFSWSMGVPLIEVNHMHAHILAHFIPSGRPGPEMDKVPAFPFICLTVSGGHTQLVLVQGFADMKILGQTQDDAAGEAFDKAAKILGLPYPGGPLIDGHAKNGNPKAYRFPDTDMPGLDFSFSGLKTAFLYFIRDQKIADPEFIGKNLADICASIQSKIVSMLMDRLVKASQQTGIKNIAIAGGVSANSALRKALEETGQQMEWNTFIPEFQYCTDNAAMIGLVAHHKYLKGEFASLDVAPVPNLDFTQ